MFNMVALGPRTAYIANFLFIDSERRC